MTTRYKMTLSYDGHAFHGFEKQPQQRTVQGCIEDALCKMTKGTPVPIRGCGRTDAGVHAYAQVLHFDYPGKQIPPRNMLLALNSMMPRDMLFTDCEIVDDSFHAQYSIKGKWYRYVVSNEHFVNPFKRFYTGHYGYPLDIKKMQEAALDLLGEHDFTSFASSGGQIKNKVRTIYYVRVTPKPEDQEVVFDFVGNGFLYNMVRIMVGALLEIGRGTRPVHDLQRVIAARDREQVRFTAPASGLYLYRVFYEKVPAELRMDLKKN
jgi:tRNA pseudouridine38-40 synthase